MYFRDIQHLTGVALQLLFFLTPIIYPVTLVPAEWNGIPLQQLIMLNPVSQFVVAFRELSYGLVVPSLSTWLVLARLGRRRAGARRPGLPTLGPGRG